MAGLNSRTRSELEPNLRAVKDGRFAPLPWSAKEVEAIADLFSEGNYTLLLGQEAGEAALKENMKKGFRYIHLASHSFANRKNPRFSGIACYYSEQDDEDGILFINEIYQQRARADLAVLSSCESGVGNLASGEGLLGLNRSFIYAGVPNVIYSLWKVDDQRSSELMVEFYKAALAGKPYPEALQQAKLHLLNQPATALPLYWSAFTLISR